MQSWKKNERRVKVKRLYLHFKPATLLLAFYFYIVTLCKDTCIFDYFFPLGFSTRHTNILSYLSSTLFLFTETHVLLQPRIGLKHTWLYLLAIKIWIAMSITIQGKQTVKFKGKIVVFRTENLQILIIYQTTGEWKKANSSLISFSQQ